MDEEKLTELAEASELDNGWVGSGKMLLINRKEVASLLNLVPKRTKKPTWVYKTVKCSDRHEPEAASVFTRETQTTEGRPQGLKQDQDLNEGNCLPEASQSLWHTEGQ